MYVNKCVNYKINVNKWWQMCINSFKDLQQLNTLIIFPNIVYLSKDVLIICTKMDIKLKTTKRQTNIYEIQYISY